MDQFILWTVLGAPLLGVFLILLGAPARLLALLATGSALLAGLALFVVTSGGSRGIVDAWKTTWVQMPLVGRVDFGFDVDGVSMPLVLLSVLVAFVAVLFTRCEKPREAEFFVLLLLTSLGATAAFASVDVISMFVFHEVALIPTFILIGRYGHGFSRASVALRMTVYLVLGSLIGLVGLIGLLQLMPPDVRTSNFSALQEYIQADVGLQNVPFWIFSTLFLGFGVLFGLFPFYSWAPNGYASAPAGVAMIHAGVLKNFGVFILLKLIGGVIPLAYLEGVQETILPLLSVLAGCNILILGLAALRQERLDLMLGYLSLMHMGYLVLGILADTGTSQTAVVMLMFGHGLATAALFGYADRLRKFSANLRLDELEGTGVKEHSLIFVFGLALMASLGLPGLAPFAGEISLLMGSFAKMPILTAVAVVGILISAIVLLRAFRKIFQLGGGLVRSELSVSATYSQPEIGFRLGSLILSAALVLWGILPNTLLKPASETVENQIRVLNAGVGRNLDLAKQGGSLAKALVEDKSK